jgi:initiation factor 1A
MPRNTTGGNKHKKGKNTNGSSLRELSTSDNESTFYGLVKAPLGGAHFAVHCSDMEDRIATVRGSIYRSTRLLSGDLILVSLRDFEKVKPGSKQHCDILLKYSSNEVTQLKRQGVYYKGSTNVFPVSLDKESISKEKNNDSVQFDNNYKITGNIKEVEEVEEDKEDSDSDSVDEYGPRKITDHIVKDIDDMSDYEDEDESSETNEESNNQN